MAAIISTSVEIPLKDLDEYEVIKLLGENNANLDSIAHQAEARTIYEESNSLITVHGSPKAVKQAYGMIMAQIDKMIEPSEMKFTILDNNFDGKVRFKKYPVGPENYYVLESIPVSISGVGALSPNSRSRIASERDQVLQQVSSDILRLLAEARTSKDIGLKFEFRLGKTIFIRRDGSDFSMENSQLGLEELQQLVHSQIVHPQLKDFYQDDILASLDEDLKTLGFQRNTATKITVRITHYEVRGKNVEQVQWITKVGDGIWRESNSSTTETLDVTQIHRNQRPVGILTCHSPGGALDARFEVSVYESEDPERVLLIRDRVRSRFRYKEQHGYRVNSKEDLIYPRSTSRKATTYKRKDVKLTVSEVRETNMSTRWEITIVTRDFGDLIQSLVAGKEVTKGRMMVELKRYLDIVDEIKKNLRLKITPKDIGYPAIGKTDLQIETSLDSGAESSSTKRMASTKSDTANQALVETDLPLTEPSGMVPPQTPKKRGPLQTLALNISMIPLAPQRNKDTNQANILNPLAPTFDRPQYRPETSETPPLSSANPTPCTSPRRSPTKLNFNEIVIDDLGRSSRLKDWDSTNDSFHILNAVPPNTPATTSNAASTTASPARPAKSSDKLFGVPPLEDDGLCGIIRPIELFKYSKEIKQQKPVDLLGSLDDIEQQDDGFINDSDEEDLICLSPIKGPISGSGICDEDDLLIG